ncbi:hypothetical protein [Chitinophaga sp. LS1]|nr:hypothetical protein [Chitinophaga sp. LS1]WPV67996.1 hypothetical protein QQL36_04555 [Chitinophaga sp. LS1]
MPGIPHLFLISPDGKVVLQKLGDGTEANYDDIEKVLKEGAEN